MASLSSTLSISLLRYRNFLYDNGFTCIDGPLFDCQLPSGRAPFRLSKTTYPLYKYDY